MRNMEKRNAWRRAYYRKHREKILAYTHWYHATHAEELRQKHREYWARIKDVRNPLRKVYTDANRERERQRAAKWRVENKDRHNATSNAWKKRNWERVYAREAKRRALKFGSAVGELRPIYEWEKHWRSLDQVICKWCCKPFTPQECHCDHIMPLSRGGSHSLDNLCISCAHCNLSKNCKTPDEWMALKQTA